MDSLTSKPLPAPAPPAPVTADVVMSGPPVPAIERIKLFSDSQWEEFVLEWADSLRSDYVSVERCGGAGDMGRDIIATRNANTGEWDNYQCKHYDHPLAPSDIWIELGKLVYYTYQGGYSYPRRYFFVAPRGVGTKLSNLLRNPAALKSQLLANWDAQCRTGVTSRGVVEMDDALTQYIATLDFAIFAPVPPLRLIDEHAKTRWHVARFGGGLPVRPSTPTPPVAPTEAEAAYLRALLDAYSDHLRQKVGVIEDLASNNELRDHLHDSRVEFYSAEALRLFSRDTLPPGEYEKLQDEVHSGIKDEVRADHTSGYRRVLAVVKAARQLQLTAHALITRLNTRDRGGICHQLAGDGRVRWVK